MQTAERNDKTKDLVPSNGVHQKGALSTIPKQVLNLMLHLYNPLEAARAVLLDEPCRGRGGGGQ